MITSKVANIEIWKIVEEQAEILIDKVLARKPYQSGVTESEIIAVLDAFYTGLGCTNIHIDAEWISGKMYVSCKVTAPQEFDGEKIGDIEI